MSEQEDWGPWIEHDGRGCPLPAGVYMAVESETLQGTLSYAEGPNPGPAPHWFGGGFTVSGYAMPIRRYRVRKPRALRQLRELIENLPAPARTPEPVE